MSTDLAPQQNMYPVWIVLASILIAGIYLIISGNNPVPQTPGSRIFMRGPILVVIRINNTKQPQEIAIDIDKIAMRRTIPVDSIHGTNALLSNVQFQQAMKVRANWCAQRPHFSGTHNPKTDYDIGFRCSERTDNYDVTQFAVPVSDLPTIFKEIDQKLPSL